MTVRDGGPAVPVGAAGSRIAACRLTIAVPMALALAAVPVAAQQGTEAVRGDSTSENEDATVVPFRSRADSLEWARARATAENTRGFRVVVSLRDRRLWVIRDADTLRAADAAVASGLTVAFAGRSWTFRTPRGRHAVQRKVVDPVWRPPDWLYAEAALANGLNLQPLAAPVPIGNDALLVVRGQRVGILDERTRTFAALPTDEHIVFNNTLYIPPLGTRNRHVEGELGRFALDLGDGYLIHGTPDERSIGRAVTHGCIRLADDDIAWLYDHVPAGTAVFIY